LPDNLLFFNKYSLNYNKAFFELEKITYNRKIDKKILDLAKKWYKDVEFEETKLSLDELLKTSSFREVNKIYLEESLDK